MGTGGRMLCCGTLLRGWERVVVPMDRRKKVLHRVPTAGHLSDKKPTKF
jgi:hypothetical protein